MSKQTINIGASPNDGTGTPLRTSFDYTNQNFTELYTAVGPSGNNIVVPGNATITGDLTVDTSTLKVDSTNNRVGIGTASPGNALHVQSSGDVARFTNGTNSAYLAIDSAGYTFFTGAGQTGNGIYAKASTNAVQLWTNGSQRYDIDSTGISTWSVAGSTAMTLDANGLGIGASPAYKLHVAGSNPTAAINSTLASISSIATLLYRNVDGNSISRDVASIAGETAGNGGYGNLIFSTGFNGSLVERMRIDLSGNVGIGVTPSAWAAGGNIQGMNGFIWSSYDASIGAGYYYASSSYKYISTAAASIYSPFGGTHKWFTAAGGQPAGTNFTPTQAMTLDASGNLLVGVTSASNQERLNVSSAVSLYVARVFNTASSGGNYGIAIRYSNAAPNNGSNEFLACSDSAASRAFIYSNGGIANYQANDSNLSDARTKTDIKPLTSYWNKIKALELVTFKYKDQTHDDDNIGLISQQVESVAPEFVSNDGFGETPADGIPLKAIYTTDLYHAAIKALQEAMTRIEALEAKLA